jgi:hypothetical protein
MTSGFPSFPKLSGQTLDEGRRLDLHAALIPLLKVFLLKRHLEFSTLCEIGCGSGRLLRECTELLPQITRYVGLHASPVQTLINRTLYRALPMRFESVSLLDWLATQAGPGSIYLTDADQLFGENGGSINTVFQAWRHSQRPTVLAIAIPQSSRPGSNVDVSLFTEIMRVARQVPFAVAMPAAATAACRLVIAEF